MSNAISLLKANYCRAIMRTAEIGTESEARRMVDGLTTETSTPDTTPAVSQAEREALLAIHDLAEHLHIRGGSVRGHEWNRATQSIAAWVKAAAAI